MTRNLLKIIVADVLSQSEASGGKLKARRLERGLVIEARVTIDKTQLRLVRSGAVNPSDREWQTVIAAFPYPVNCAPAQFTEGNNRVLSGSWTTPKKLL